MNSNRRHRAPRWRLYLAVVAPLSLVLFFVDPITASTSKAHVPRQRMDQPLNPHPDVMNSNHQITLAREEGDALPLLATSNSMVRVLPPSPDDSLTELECGPNATLYETCGGAERYCAPLPNSHKNDGNHSSSNSSQELPAWLFSQDNDYSILGNGTDNHTTLPPIPDNNNNNLQYYCLHKTLWYPSLDARDLLMLFLATTCCFLAAMAGIGGGGLILPILLLVNQFTPKEASVLSNTAVFCNTVGQFFVNQRKNSNSRDGENSGTTTAYQHQQQQQVVYATVLMIMPGVIAGGSLAITLEGMVPSTAILILALFTLLLASTKTYFKAKKMRCAEQQQQQNGIQPPVPSFLSPIPVLTSPSYSRLNRQNHHPQSPRRLNVHFQQQRSNDPNDEYGEEDQQLLDDNKEASALVESALEWGSVLAGDSGGSKQQLAIDTTPAHLGRATPSGEDLAPDSCPSIDNISLLDVNDTSNQEIMEERFFGSIGYLIRAAMTPEENTALIIDESSVAASLAASIDYYLGSGTNGRGPAGDALNFSRGSVYRHVGVCGRCCAFCSRHKLEFLIGGFWMLDATTFLLLHTGSLVPQCSTGYFVLLACPALVAAIFVGLGRCHLQGQKRRLARPIRRGMRTGSANEPLYFSLFPGSPSTSSEDDEENRDNPGPVPIIDRNEETSISSAPLDSHRWILLLPLASLCAGILNAFRHRPFYRESHQRSQDGGNQDLSVPFLSPSGGAGSPAGSNTSLFSTPSHDNGSPNSERDGDSQQDNFQSLLVWWLPFASVLIGLLAALLGIGGGELLGPILLLLLKMDPQESSATTAIMSMMNSGTNLLHYIVADMVTAPGYAFHLGLAGLIGGSGGRMWAISMAQKGRTSVIAMSLCGVLSLATALVGWELFTTPVSWESNQDLC